MQVAYAEGVSYWYQQYMEDEQVRDEHEDVHELGHQAASRTKQTCNAVLGESREVVPRRMMLEVSVGKRRHLPWKASECN